MTERRITRKSASNNPNIKNEKRSSWFSRFWSIIYDGRTYYAELYIPLNVGQLDRKLSSKCIE